MPLFGCVVMLVLDMRLPGRNEEQQAEGGIKRIAADPLVARSRPSAERFRVRAEFPRNAILFCRLDAGRSIGLRATRARHAACFPIGRTARGVRRPQPSLQGLAVRRAHAGQREEAMKTKPWVYWLAACVLVAGLAGCSGGTRQNTTPSSVSGGNSGSSGGSGVSGGSGAAERVLIYPNTVTVLYRGNQAFRAAVIPPGLVYGEGTPLDASWTIQEGAAGGAITSGGVYTAPPVSGTYHVIATSVADPSKTVIAWIRVIQSGPGFASTASMLTDRFGFTVTLLPDGRVLVAAGGTRRSDGGTDAIGGAELYDPADGTFHRSSSTASLRIFHSANLLSNGKVLLAGGLALNASNATTLNSAEIYDPSTDSFAATGQMISARQGHTMTLLRSGNVLVAGGKSDDFLASAEIYDLATGQFAPTGSMITARKGHTATLLPDGRVLIAGGEGASGALATVELFDPATNSFASAGTMSAPRDLHTATLLGNGKVLIAGG